MELIQLKSFLLKKNSVFMRLLFSMLAVMIPLILIGIGMFLSEKQAIQTEIEKNTSANVSFVSQYLEEEVDNIKQLQYELANDPMLTQLIAGSKIPSYDYYTIVNDIQRRLHVMKYSNVLIDDIIVYFPGLQHVISVTGGYEALDSAKYQFAANYYLQLKSPIGISDGKVYSISTFPPQSSPKTTSLYLIEVRLSMEGFRSVLSKFANSGNGGIAAYNFETGSWAIGSSGIEDLSALGLKPTASRNITAATDVVGGKHYYIAYKYSEFLNLVIAEFVPLQDMFRLPNTYGYLLWAYAGISLFVLVYYSYQIFKSVKQPMDKIVSAFQSLERGNLDENIKFKAADEFNYLYEEFNNMVECLNLMIDNSYRQQLFVQEAELKQLQSQINPHFLYNSYFMIDRMIKAGDLENARALSSHLGVYFRFITRNTANEVTLMQEAEHADSYAQIQQMRFSKQMSVEFGEIPERYRNFMVPRMILQPIVENVFEHGLRDIDSGGLLCISFRDEGPNLVISIEDNGKNLTDGDIEELRSKLSLRGGNETEVTAIFNVHKRIALKFGSDSGVRLSRSALGGLKAEIRIFTGELNKA